MGLSDKFEGKAGVQSNGRSDMRAASQLPLGESTDWMMLLHLHVQGRVLSPQLFIVALDALSQ